MLRLFLIFGVDAGVILMTHAAFVAQECNMFHDKYNMCHEQMLYSHEQCNMFHYNILYVS